MRTGRESHAELDRLLEEAIRLLESMDLYGANEVLKKAGAEAASLRVADPTPEAGSSPPEQGRAAGTGAVDEGRQTLVLS